MFSHPTKSTIMNCEICFESLDVQKMTILECSHRFCSGCILEMIKVEIDGLTFTRISCPQINCRRIISEKFITSFLEKESLEDLINKYQKLRQSYEIIQDPTQLPCIKPGCDYVLQVENKHIKKKRKCDKCGTRFCGACREENHFGTFCTADTEANFEKFRRNYIIGNCPACRVPLEKDSGCNHMTCKICRHHFCWVCRGRYTSNHFSSMNFIFGCPGMGSTPPSQIRSVRMANFVLACFYLFALALCVYVLWRLWFFFFILLKSVLAVSIGAIWFMFSPRKDLKFYSIPISIFAYFFGQYILVMMAFGLLAMGSVWSIYQGCQVVSIIFREIKYRQKLKAT
jgi:E3 ubiquitin-protein ligase RNF19A